MEIINTLRHQPGATKAQLCRILSLSWGTISYHVRLLEQEHVLTRKRLYGRTRLFLLPLPTENSDLAELAVHPAIPELLRNVVESPGIGIQALATALALDRRLIRRHLDLLIDAGLVAQTRDYRPKFFVIEQSRANDVIKLAKQSPPR